MFELATTLVVFGLVEILIAIVVVLLIALMVSTFGLPELDNFRSRCPACTRNGLQPLDAGANLARHRHRSFACRECGVAFREEHDGSLVRMDRDP